MKNKVYKLNKTGRVAYEFPWETKAADRPWKDGYTRVLIPLTAAERKNAKPGTKAHMQIVALRNLSVVKEPKLFLNVA